MAQQLTPEVLWAQRSSSTDETKNYIYLTINVADVAPADLTLDIQPTKLTFTGKSGAKKATYHVELEFYAEIDPAETKKNHTSRDVELVLRKKELKDEFWPRLLKESKKMHFLKTDFDKWVDEDEQDAVADDDDAMAKMGGMQGMEGMGGMPGMGGLGGDGGFGGIDFSKLSGAMGGDGLGGIPGAGGLDDEDDDEGDEEDDEELPELDEPAGEAKAGAATTKTGSGIEELE